MGRGGAQGGFGPRGGTAQTVAVNYDAIILNGDVDALVKGAEEVARNALSVSSSQIRGIFATVRQVQLTWDTDRARGYRQAVLLKPRISYADARNDLGPLKGALIGALDKVGGTEAERRERFMRFVDFFEAIVAYHKSFGGKK